MPRKNKRKSSAAISVSVNTAENGGGKPECAGCAFAGNNLICTTSDGKCLKTAKPSPERREAGNAVSKR